jgi:hypothetical protein
LHTADKTLLVQALAALGYTQIRDSRNGISAYHSESGETIQCTGAEIKSSGTLTKERLGGMADLIKKSYAKESVKKSAREMRFSFVEDKHDQWKFHLQKQ